MDMDVNIETMKVTFLADGTHHAAGEEYNLMRDANNQRCRRQDSVKGFKEQFNIKQAVEMGFPKSKGEFGFRWKVVKNNRCQPSIR